MLNKLLSIDIENTSKTCFRCKQIKLISEFNKNKSKKDGYEHLCRSCFNPESRIRVGKHRLEHREELNKKNLVYLKKRYKENPKKFTAQAKKYRKDLRAEFIKEYGGKCACCEESISEFLTLEHKNRDGKKDRDKFKTSSGILANLRKRGWPKDNYELLCFNCNRGKWENGICPHKRIIDEQS